MSITTNIDQGSAFTALSSAPGLITTIFGKNDVVKYISGTIKSLGYEPCELIGSVEYCVLNDDHDRFYLRSHRNGCDILMETIALTEMSNGDKIMLERIVNYEGDLVPQQQNQLLVPTPAISKVPHEIVQDFLVNGSVGIHWVNSDGTIVWANKADMDICGYTPDEYIGSPIAAYYDDDKVLKDILRKLRANQILKDYPARLKHRDGSIRYVLIDSSTNFDKNGNFINTRCFTRDVTEAHKLETIKKEAELAQSKSIQKALDMKSLFLAQMSHDIRTPLNGVIGMTSLLQTTELTKEQQEFIAIIESSSSFLLTLIQDILDHSKIEAGKVDLDPQPTNLVQLTKECASIVSVECIKKDVALVVQPPEDASTYTLMHNVDKNRLKQIVLNCLSNAVKFTTVGSVTISLSIQPVSADGTTTSTAVDDDEKCHKKTGDSLLDKVVIAVEDTGIGIEDVTDLFTDFKQATKSTTREYGGTGLGLSIVKNLTSLMRGKVNLESTLGKGTKIWCELCLSRCLEVPRSVPPFPSVMTTKKARPLNNENNEEVQLRKDCFRILVAEDIQTNQRILLNMMKRLGYNKNNIEFAENGQIAVDKYLQSLNSKDKNMKFDLILMDCLMPVLGGIEATTKIREIEGEDVSSCHIPILALTASAQKSDQDECMAAGMDAFITKPIILKTLDEELSNWLNTVGSEGSTSTKKLKVAP